LTPACASVIESRWSGTELLKSTFNAKISYAGCLGLSLAISVQFTVTKTPYFGDPRSF